MHRSFDRHDKKGVTPKTRDKFAMYRNQKYKHRPSRYPVKRRTSTRYSRNHAPTVKRKYYSKAKTRQRYRADDLNDNADQGSLWNQEAGASASLFTNDSDKRMGDIVLINIFKKLKSEITAELKRAFPRPKKKAKKNSPKTGKPEKTAAKAPEKDKDADKAFDRISSIIVEEINKKHVLLRGRKSLIYNKRKRLVEVQALVSRRDITNDDSISSDQILESTVSIVR